MGNYIQALGEQMGGQAAGGIMGLLLGGINDHRQIRQQRDLQNLQIAGNKTMIDYGMMKQLEMWKNTSYGAQVEQMKKAGINPALLYGMSGGGGQTTGNATGNVQGAAAPTGGREVQDIMGLQMQRELLRAQKENIEADTANKKADIPVKGATATNLEATTGLTKIQTQMAKIATEVANATIDEAIYKITAEVAKAQQQVMQMEVKTEIDRATKQDTITQIKAEAISALLKNLQTKAQTEETKMQISKIQQEVAKSKDEQFKTMPEQRRLISAQIQAIWNAIRKSYDEGANNEGLLSDIMKLIPLAK